jgi:hypothetical protein
LIVLVIGKEDGLLAHYRPSEEQMDAAWEAFGHSLRLCNLREDLTTVVPIETVCPDRRTAWTPGQ